MSSSPKISIVIPCFNKEEYIANTLKSVVSQKIQDIEVICVDDGSTDRTLQILEEFSNKDQRFRIFRNQHMGVSAARNTGIEHANGEYLAVVDADDEVTFGGYEGMLTAAYADCRGGGGDFIHSPLQSVNGASVKTEKHKYKINTLYVREQILRDILPYLINVKEDPGFGIHGHHTNLYRMSVIKEHHLRYPDDRPTAEDHVFIVQFLRYAQTAAFADVPAYRYIHHPGTLISKFAREKLLFILKNMQDYTEWFAGIYDFDDNALVSRNMEHIRILIDSALISAGTLEEAKETIRLAVDRPILKRYLLKTEPQSHMERRVKQCIEEGNVNRIPELYTERYYWLKATYFVKQQAKRILKK